MLGCQALKQNMPRELKNIITRTTEELSSSADQANILLEFLQVILEQFRAVLEMYKFGLETLKNKYHRSSNVLDLKDVWHKMQIVVNGDWIWDNANAVSVLIIFGYSYSRHYRGIWIWKTPERQISHPKLLILPTASCNMTLIHFLPEKNINGWFVIYRL